jgi:hypothetical protein
MKKEFPSTQAALVLGSFLVLFAFGAVVCGTRQPCYNAPQNMISNDLVV